MLKIGGKDRRWGNLWLRDKEGKEIKRISAS